MTPEITTAERALASQIIDKVIDGETRAYEVAKLVATHYAELREDKARLDWLQSRYAGGEAFGLPFPLIRKHDSVRSVLDIMRQREAQQADSSEKN